MVAQTVSRAIEVLEFCSRRPRELREISELWGVHRTTALRLVQTLIAGGLIRKDERGRYGVGFRLAALAESALEQFDLRTVVHPHIVELSERVGQTVQFAVPQGDHLVYVDKIEPPSSIRLNTRIGGYATVHTAGVSKAYLAHVPSAVRERILAGADFEKYTDTTLTSRTAFEERLIEVARQGWAYDDGEYETLSNCIAAPVWDHSGSAAGGISITAIKTQSDLGELRKLLPTLLETTEVISRELGWLPPEPSEPAADPS
ncbi:MULTISPECIES: IclR family transcriptional regulator [Streptomyces]|uniref:IclR family transcriptional regulator n=1 Tax=Streptomyces TaxID=1883 RepID=UPI000F0BE782|nr:IclR family transcriptional regulator [Streptomyces sp. SCSIO ZS0520]AYN31355.1 IclR family transcriptional regulator [Streptomyces albus]